jgi:hypothetical protein
MIPLQPFQNLILNGPLIRERILSAAKANDIPAGASGLWTVRKLIVEKPTMALREGKLVEIPPGLFTYLLCYTTATLHQEGECVMHDTPDELNTHLDFMMRARGRVLITGLGLGCAVRGCLANPAVRHVTCIEKSRDVLKLVAPYMPQDRLSIIHADAIEWTARNKVRFDCAWHDLWSNPDMHEEHLQIMHSHLLANVCHFADFQGAWAFPRDSKRLWGRTITMV